VGIAVRPLLESRVTTIIRPVVFVKELRGVPRRVLPLIEPLYERPDEMGLA
jgi:hypothetical protein